MSNSIRRRSSRRSEDVFWEKVDVIDGGCWMWKATTSRGYGQFFDRRSSRTVGAHRWSFELLVGPIPKGLELDHLCRNRACVNPAHLEPVDHKENVRRGLVPKTHCLRGHDLAVHAPTSTDGRRHCRECQRVRIAAKRASQS